jgi:NADH dehydrogenase
VATNWALNTVAGHDFVGTGLLSRSSAKLRDFEHTNAYLTPEQIRERTETG